MAPQDEKPLIPEAKTPEPVNVKGPMDTRVPGFDLLSPNDAANACVMRYNTDNEFAAIFDKFVGRRVGNVVEPSKAAKLSALDEIVEGDTVEDNGNGTYDIMIRHPVYGLIPFTASKDDPEEHGRLFYELASAKKKRVSPKGETVVKPTLKDGE